MNNSYVLTEIGQKQCETYIAELKAKRSKQRRRDQSKRQRSLHYIHIGQQRSVQKSDSNSKMRRMPESRFAEY